MWSHIWPLLLAFGTAYAILGGVSLAVRPRIWFAFGMPERPARVVGSGLLLVGLGLAAWAGTLYRFAGTALVVYLAILVAGLGLGLLLSRTSPDRPGAG